MGERYSKNDFFNSKFYQLSKELFFGKYKKLSNNERVLYSILKDRFELSVKNNWIDNENNIFFYYQQEDLVEECCMSLRTVQRAMQGLVEVQLIESVRQGQNQPNRLYLLKPEREKPENKRTCQNDVSGHDNLTHPDTSNWRTIYTDNNYTNIDKSSSSSNEENREENWKNKIDLKQAEERLPKDMYEKVLEIIDDLVNAPPETICMIAGKKVLAEEVSKKIISKLNTSNYISVVKAIAETPGTIKQMRPYVISCFYNFATGDMRINNAQKVEKNRFNEFEQREYDFEEIEKKLLRN